MTELKDVIETLDQAADSFDGIATKEQKKIYDEVVVLAKDLETDVHGKVKQSIANLKRLTQIKAKLAALSKDKEWVAGITHFAQYFGHLQKMQNEYYSQHFTESTLGMNAQKKNQLMREMAVQNTMEALMGDGLKANVTDKLNDILLRAVTSGAKFADLQDELRAHLMGENGGKGAFARYATTYATTALSQFAGQTNKLMTDDLGLEWFMYTGSNKETTREFCEHLTAKKYIHKSEIPTILTGKIDDYQCAIYEKTGLPLGMIAGTTPENFQCNCGGWNCRHQLVPVHELAVPADIRAKFKQIRPTIEKPIGQQPIDLSQYREQISNIEKYIAEHPKSAKIKGYLDGVKQLAKEGNEDLLKSVLKAANADIRKFEASANVKTKKNAAIEESHKEWTQWTSQNEAWLSVTKSYASKAGIEIDELLDKTKSAKELDKLKTTIGEAIKQRQNEFDDAVSKASDIVYELIQEGESDISIDFEDKIQKFNWDGIKNDAMRQKQLAELNDIIVRGKETLKKVREPLYKNVVKRLKARNIAYHKINTNKSAISEEEIIKKVGINDPVGYCSSLAFAYAANKAGLDVVDSRGGKSAEFFSTDSQIMEIARSLGGEQLFSKNEVADAYAVLAKVQEGHEYYFGCARHAAIVRKKCGELEFLDLQEFYKDGNGWRILSLNELRRRFDARNINQFATATVLVDLNNMRNSLAFKDMVGYIHNPKK